jgi:predicted alpha/beta hydrolase family esterase
VTAATQVLFVQGAGPGTYDEWDSRMVDSLRRELGDSFDVRYPRLPDESDPSSVAWSAAIHREIAALDDGAVVVGHSVGGAVLVHALAERPPERELALIVLVAAPFVGAGGWPGDEFELSGDLGARLPRGVPVRVFHGLGDETVPPSHADRYAQVLPQALRYLLPGRDHQLGDDLVEVAQVITRDVAPPR